MHPGHELRDSIRLAWNALRNEAKRNGRGGTVTVTPSALVERYRLAGGVRAVNLMLELAEVPQPPDDLPAIQRSGAVIHLVQWAAYQDPKNRGNKRCGLDPRFSKTRGIQTDTNGGFTKKDRETAFSNQNQPFSKNSATGTGQEQSQERHPTDPRAGAREIDRPPVVADGSTMASTAAMGPHDSSVGVEGEAVAMGPLWSDVYAALGRWKQAAITASEEGQFRTMAYALGEAPLAIGGASVHPWALLIRCISEVIEDEKPFNTHTSARALLTSIFERCIRQGKWPGEFPMDRKKGANNVSDKSISRVAAKPGKYAKIGTRVEVGRSHHAADVGGQRSADA